VSKYTGFDKVADGKIPATEKFVELCGKRWGFKNLGTLVVRVMRSAPADIQKLDPHDPKCKPYMSVHATGRAADIDFGGDKEKAVQAINWFTRDDVVAALGIEEVHDYAGNTKKGCEKWGRGWRIGRGWKDWTATDNGGTPGAGWIHVEISPTAAALTADAFEAAWRALPKP
jgi:hypothetical protein